MVDKLSENAFYKFVREVLERIVVEAGQRIIFDYKTIIHGQILMEYDAVCPNGFGDIGGKVLFEIKSRKISSKVIMKYMTRLRNDIEYRDAKVVFIINDWIGNNLVMDNVIIWDLSKIEEWGKIYSIELFNAIHSTNDAGNADNKNISLENIPNETDFYNINNRYIKGLSNSIGNGAQLGIVLGAGVSIEQGAKKWDDLIADLKVMAQGRGLVDDANALAGKVGGNSTTTAQLCLDVFKNKNDFEWEVHQSLYAHDKGKIKKGSELEAVSRLAKKYRTLKHFRILTYNYDDYLERYLNYMRLEYCTLSSQKDVYYKGKSKTETYELNGTVNDSFGVYHVHGYLPQAPNKSSLRGSIVLTEADYNLLYNQPYSWPITSQMMIFRENTCLFIGCSLVDLNIRRLLELAYISNHWHYAILKKEGLSNKDLLQVNAHFYRLGLRIIWIDDYSEIVSILDRI